MSLDVNGNDNSPEWGWCRTEGCKEEAFPIWKTGDYPDDPDLLLCPKHIGELIADLSGQIGEQNTTIGYQDAMLKHSLAELEAARAVIAEVRWSIERREWAYVAQRNALAAYDAAVKAREA
jgi:hypothetical protein